MYPSAPLARDLERLEKRYPIRNPPDLRGLWSPSTRYRATVVDSEPYLLTLMRYIELNPVRAGMVENPIDYHWSSYAFNALGESGLNADWLTPHEEYLRLERNATDRQSVYRQLFDAAISDINLNEIRECTHKGWALGNEQFGAQIEALGQRRAASKGVGRPRKVINRV